MDFNEYKEIINLVDRCHAVKIFPLQTIQSMAERWGVSKQTVNNWANRHEDFAKPMDGIIAATAKTPAVYPLHEVERYERERGLLK